MSRSNVRRRCVCHNCAYESAKVGPVRRWTAVAVRRITRQLWWVCFLAHAQAKVSGVRYFNSNLDMCVARVRRMGGASQSVFQPESSAVGKWKMKTYVPRLFQKK